MFAARPKKQYLYGRKHGKFLKAPLDFAKCGTAAQARAHERRGEKPCAACLTAKRRYDSDQRCKS
jgi:hypothetical protein